MSRSVSANRTTTRPYFWCGALHKTNLHLHRALTRSSLSVEERRPQGLKPRFPWRLTRPWKGRSSTDSESDDFGIQKQRGSVVAQFADRALLPIRRQLDSNLFVIGLSGCPIFVCSEPASFFSLLFASLLKLPTPPRLTGRSALIRRRPLRRSPMILCVACLPAMRHSPRRRRRIFSPSPTGILALIPRCPRSSR